ncbi:ABC transporter ATP-binding protein [Mycoplasma tauri]|uniref:ABC transporter ATP-binding protein n=1 Tax=Mycoplasma tauri TaxID=547987 RepID=UPI0019689E60|nr:ABC transporter ATP-binding protein [Mycoplasma tauri]QSB07400.1 ABC transporter ATP-binding protein [Mycoplasma tauri]
MKVTKAVNDSNNENHRVSTIALLKFSLKFMKNDKKVLIIGFLLSIIDAFMYTFGTAMTGFLIKWFFTEDVLIGKESFKSVEFIFAMIGMALSFLISFIAKMFQNRLMIYASFKATARMRSKASKNLLYMPISYHDKNKVGDKISTLTNDINNISQTLVQMFNEASGMLFKLLFVVFFMLLYSLTLSAIVLPIIICFAIVSWLFLAKARKPYIEMINKFGDMNAYVEEMLKNSKVTQSFDRQKKANHDFEKIANGIRKSSFRGDLYTKFFEPYFVIFSNFLILIVLAISFWFKNGNVWFAGVLGNEVIAIINGYIQFLWTFTSVLQLFFNFVFSTQIGVASTTRIFKLIELDPPKKIENPQYLDSKKVEGYIEFDNVSFRYSKKMNEYQLKNASFSANPGEVIAIVGPTGAGKTTIISLLSKFYEYESGSIKIDGLELKNIPKDNLLDLMTVVLQDSFMFNDTIINNLKVGNPNISDEDVFEAAKLTNAHQFIQNYKNGYQTIIENNGANLSQGEKQLLSITRAILGNKKILVLDEATSNVDSNTEKIIQDALQNTVMKGKTSFVIAHRLSTIRNADTIIVVDHGQIIEKGNHRELMNKKGFYYELHESQFN